MLTLLYVTADPETSDRGGLLTLGLSTERDVTVQSD
jgi:hypothetical protein